MKLNISEAISLILAIPAHRSHIESHRKIGEKAIELLLDYKNITTDETEKAFNISMIGSVLSAVRAFSIERDRISSEWKSIEAIRNLRERLLEIFRNLSPLSKGNYWSKALLLLIAFGIASKDTFNNLSNLPFIAVVSLLILIVLAEITSKVGEFLFAYWFEKKLPIEKVAKWESESLVKYKSIIKKFIDEAVDIQKRYYPDNKIIDGYDISVDEKTIEFREKLIEKHFYL